MSKSHNKKRNVGIIYEQLLRTMAAALVSDDTKKYKDCLNIVRQHFAPGTQLYREFRLFNAMVKTTVDKETLAIRILEEAKRAALDFDSEKLRNEKAALIKAINYTFADPTFYHQHVNEYRKYATIQTLLNDWRMGDDASLARIADYENKVCDFLLNEQKAPSAHVTKNDDVSSLTVKLMIEKFNTRYGKQLNDEQQALIREYIFSNESGDYSYFKTHLSELKANMLSELNLYSKACNNRILNEKMDAVKSAIRALDPETIADETVTRFLLISQLKEEITETDSE